MAGNMGMTTERTSVQKSGSQNVTPQNMRIPGMRGPRRVLEVEKPVEGKKTLRKLMQYFKNERLLVLGLLLIVVVVVISSITAPKLQSDAIDSITKVQLGSLWKIIIFMLVTYGVYSFSTLAQNIISARLSQRIVKKMRQDLFDKIVHLPIKYIDQHPHGDIMSRMTNDVENISNTVSQSIGSLFSGVLTITGTVAMMLWLCVPLALLSCTTVILTVIATKNLSRVMRKYFSKRQVLLGGLNSIVEEKVTGFKTVVAYNQQENVINEFEKTSDELTKTGIIAEIFGGSMGPVMNAINNIGFVIIAAFGGFFSMKGMISIGVISAFIVYAKQFGRPINEIAQVYGQIQSAIAGAERIFALMEEKEECQEGSKDLSDAKGIITFENVHFSYTPEKEVLHDFNLQVRAGHKVALVGATGSGKTTVVNLLMRFYDLDSGRILIDDTDIRDIELGELRKNTAIVLQDTVLFADTIRNNLKYSKLDATDEEMIRAAQMSHCRGMIEHMHLQYESMLTENGENLSQGQRQLLSIARAFLADPKILILDEATSSVDTRTEQHIQDAMIKLMKNRTSIIIAHRLSTIRDADLIVVMDQGRIVETGNHEELMKQQGKYYELYMTQFAGSET
ncbi:MAG: ABC transporter ATP-binding protein [Lachnospira sp.]|nr:ABC transporter ATP-binding protein [Lachnospira sp.]